jgi:hypothetical protein
VTKTHRINVSHKKGNLNQRNKWEHSWSLDNYDEKVGSGDTIIWSRSDKKDGNAKSFRIVVEQTQDISWGPANQLTLCTNYPFANGSYYYTDSVAQGNDQLVTLTVSTNHPTTNLPQYFVLVPTNEPPDSLMSRGFVGTSMGDQTILRVPYYYYMIDAVLIWE